MVSLKTDAYYERNSLLCSKLKQTFTKDQWGRYTIKSDFRVLSEWAQNEMRILKLLRKPKRFLKLD